MAFVFWRSQKTLPENKGEEAAPESKISPNRLITSAALAFYALLAIAGSVYVGKVYQNSPITLVLWLLFIILLLSAGIFYDRIQPFSWIGKMKTLDAAARKNLGLEILLVVVLTGIGLALRTFDLTHYPPMMHGDEGEIGMVALGILGRGAPVNLFGFSWSNIPSLFVVLQALSISILGRNEIGLRMSSALAGTACIPLVYLIGRRGWGKLAGFSAAWLLAISHFYIQYSRLAIGVIESVFLILLFVLLILAPFFPKKRQDAQAPDLLDEADQATAAPPVISLTLLISTGLVIGLTQYGYFGVRYLTPLMALFIYGYLLIRKRIQFYQVLIVALTALLVFAPFGMLMIQSPDMFFGRMNDVSILSAEGVSHNYGADVTWSKDAVYIISQQLNRNLNFFLQSGDASPFYTQEMPIFDLMTALFFWLGLGIVATRIKRLWDLSLFFWFGVGIFLAGILTIDSPMGSRLIIISPSVFLVAGVFVQRTWHEIKAFLTRVPEITLSLVWLAFPILGVLLAGTLAINFYNYFYVFANSGINILSISLAREIKQDYPANHVYLMGDGYIYAEYGTIRFIAGEHVATNLIKTTDLKPIAGDGKGTTILAVGSHIAELKSIQSQYPAGVWSDFKDPIGQVVYAKYQISPE